MYVCLLKVWSCLTLHKCLTGYKLWGTVMFRIKPTRVLLNTERLPSKLTKSGPNFYVGASRVCSLRNTANQRFSDGMPSAFNPSPLIPSRLSSAPLNMVEEEEEEAEECPPNGSQHKNFTVSLPLELTTSADGQQRNFQKSLAKAPNNSPVEGTRIKR